MKRLSRVGVWAAILILLACQTGRSGVGMADDLARLEKEAEDLRRHYERTAEEREETESQLERARAAYEEAVIALARRDQLREELEALGYSPRDAEAYATVAEAGGDQVRRETIAAGEKGERPPGGRGSEKAFRPRGRYAGPHTIHVVAKGEYLYKIASYEKYYADGERWPLIYEANAYQIKDPHWIFAGQRLQIPMR